MFYVYRKKSTLLCSVEWQEKSNIGSTVRMAGFCENIDIDINKRTLLHFGLNVFCEFLNKTWIQLGGGIYTKTIQL